MPDIDIDFTDRDAALTLIKHVAASRSENSQLVKHNTGVYLQEVPFDLEKNLCAIPYEIAEEQGYFKIDFLNVNVYKGIQSEDHLLKLMNQEPLWDLLEQEEFCNLLFHINGHSRLLKTMKPKNVEQLAAVLAMIRPAKKHLVGKDWNEVLAEVWNKPESNEYYFKKSHATAYALTIVVQMNLICESISYDYS
jgi:DNA polymerase III alpha subunit